MIRVGIDVSRIRDGMTGVGRYAAGILSSLDTAMPEAKFVLYAYRETSIVPASSRWHVVKDRHPFWSRIPVTQWMHSRLGVWAAEGSDVGEVGRGALNMHAYELPPL